MKYIALLALAVIVLALSGSATGGTSIAPHTETNQSAYFYNQAPGQVGIQFTVYQYEGDPFPYTRGANAYSSGTVHTNVALDDLAANYGSNGEEGPVYEVNACLYPQASAPAVHRAAKTMNRLARIGRAASRLRSGAIRRSLVPILAARIRRLSQATTATALDCTPDTYVGYYPESMWYYKGAKVRTSGQTELP